MYVSNPRVIVTVEGRVVTEIFSDRPLNVDVLDHDNWQVTDRSEEQDHFAARQRELEERRLRPQM